MLKEIEPFGQTVENLRKCSENTYTSNIIEIIPEIMDSSIFQFSDSIPTQLKMLLIASIFVLSFELCENLALQTSSLIKVRKAHDITMTCFTAIIAYET